MAEETAIEDVVDACRDPSTSGLIDLRARRLRGTAIDLRSALRRRAFHVAVIDASTVSDEKALLERLGREFDFPSYYGVNWHALDECLFDLSEWLETRNYCCIVTNAAELASKQPESFRLLCDAFSSASDYHCEEKGVSMKLVLL